MNFLDQLKVQTLPQHQKLEKLLMGKMRTVNSTEGYLQILDWFYNYFGPLEIRIAKFLDTTHLPDYPDRRKTENLRQDILFFSGQEPRQIAEVPLPEIEDTEQAFGALYVMEGSTLGGSVISKIMRRQLDAEAPNGFSFFEGYGDNTTAMWTAFQSALLENIKPESQEKVIQSAGDTFNKFSDFIQTHTPSHENP